MSADYNSKVWCSVPGLCEFFSVYFGRKQNMKRSTFMGKKENWRESKSLGSRLCQRFFLARSEKVVMKRMRATVVNMRPVMQMFLPLSQHSSLDLLLSGLSFRLLLLPRPGPIQTHFALLCLYVIDSMMTSAEVKNQYCRFSWPGKSQLICISLSHCNASPRHNFKILMPDLCITFSQTLHLADWFDSLLHLSTVTTIQVTSLTV